MTCGEDSSPVGISLHDTLVVAIRMVSLYIEIAISVHLSYCQHTLSRTSLPCSSKYTDLKFLGITMLKRRRELEGGKVKTIIILLKYVSIYSSSKITGVERGS